MFCPRCGNQPASDRPRFCPTCGLRLDGVADLLVRDGLYIPPPIMPQAQAPSPRKRGIQRGGKITFTGLAMFLPVLAFAIGVADSPGPLVLPGTILVTGLFWMLYYWLFGDEYTPAATAAQTINPPVAKHQYLPHTSTPVYKPSIDAPKSQSVIEHTTRSLEKQ